MVAALLLAFFAPDDVTISFDLSKGTTPISPYIYGTNRNAWSKQDGDLTIGRQGGNRMTAYNWETNASNAGNDYKHQNDSFLGGGETPGEVPRLAVEAAQEAGKAFIVTIPMAGYVSADKKGDGDVNQTPNYLATRFDVSLPKKGSAFAYPPDLSDHKVYQDEFVSWLEGKYPNRKSPIWYSLDNEPDIWASTHVRIHPKPLTYAEIIQRTHDYASAIKAVAPGTMIFGPASYGWNGYTTLQNAPDGGGRDFLEFYLAEMQKQEKAGGKRLLDVLDLHWYPEAHGGGKRITESDAAPAVAEARMQATRSLWDPGYRESSWINDSLGGPIRLIPRMKEKIAKFYPGTKLAFTEYNYGGGSDISGAIAQADALGIFGREGVFVANLWPLTGDYKFTSAAFDAYRNFDGKGATFGDESVPVTSKDPSKVTAYASTVSGKPGRMVFVLVNQDLRQRTCKLQVPASRHDLKAYVITKETPEMRRGVTLPSVSGMATFSLPAMSVTTILLTPTGR